MNEWLKDFAYRVSIGAVILIVPGVAVLIVALMVVAMQAFRSATTDPVKALRTE
jgi:putative ABC transport system permease protein